MHTRRLAVLLAASVLALAGCGDDGAEDPTPASASTKHHATDSADPEESPSTQDQSVTVPVYFVGDTPQGPRLYREFQRIDADDPLDGALNLAASGAALDPDYTTLLPAGTFTGSTSSDGISIPLPDDSWTRLPEGLSETDALLAVQQIVYTAQGVLQDRQPVTFTDSAGNATQIFGIASEDGFTAADPIDTLALMSVTSPETGQTVSGTLEASGVGSSFEANVLWKIQDSAGKSVLKGHATAEGWMDKLYPWETEIDVSDLAPGDYTFVASTDDPSDGEGGGPTVDTKAFTIG